MSGSLSKTPFGLSNSEMRLLCLAYAYVDEDGKVSKKMIQESTPLMGFLIAHLSTLIFYLQHKVLFHILANNPNSPITERLPKLPRLRWTAFAPRSAWLRERSWKASGIIALLGLAQSLSVGPMLTTTTSQMRLSLVTTPIRNRAKSRHPLFDSCLRGKNRFMVRLVGIAMVFASSCIQTC